LKNGEIENYYSPASDRLLYEALRDRLVAFNGNAAKAFAEPFYKPKSDGTPGPLVKKVKLTEKSTLNVPVYGGNGVAANDSMVRIDVFGVEGDGYYFVPVYIADTLKKELPNKACVAFKDYSEWKEMKEEDFLFSLYPNDLFKATHRRAMKLTKLQKESFLPEAKETKSEYLYFKSAGISAASITCISHDNSYGISSLGIKTLEKLEKYTVDVLGDVHAVKKEKRQGFADMKRG
jgi:CRISPR-associated endonuclease Csn1